MSVSMSEYLQAPVSGKAAALPVASSLRGIARFVGCPARQRRLLRKAQLEHHIDPTSAFQSCPRRQVPMTTDREYCPPCRSSCRSRAPHRQSVVASVHSRRRGKNVQILPSSAYSQLQTTGSSVKKGRKSGRVQLYLK